MTLWQTIFIVFTSQLCAQNGFISVNLCHIFDTFIKITRWLRCRNQTVERQAIESVTVDNDAHFKTHDKTKQNQHAKKKASL